MADEVTRQLIWDRLLALVEEQAQTLMRTAFSTVVREAGDLSAGVFDASGRMLAQAVTGTPGHVNSMAEAVGKFLRRFPLETLVPGDVLVTNDPWDGTGHLNDFTVVTPVFCGGVCVALFASTSHIADVGGRGFGADANDLFEEGIRVPVSRLFHAGAPDATLFAMLRANVRDPVVMEGDLYSLTVCNDVGAAALKEVMADFSMTSLDEISTHIVTVSQRAMGDAIRALPNGVVGASMVIDGYDAPLELTCELIVSDERIRIDFADTPASRFGINVPLPYTVAYATFGVRCLVGNEIPNNAGSLSAITVTAPEGSLLAARSPSPVSARHAVGQMLPDVVMAALAQLPGLQVPAQGASCIWNPVIRNTGGARREFVINPIFNGGTGARAECDGLSTTAFPSGVRTTSTEINELTAPLVFWKRELRENSGGPGRYRGGLGQHIELSHLDGAPFVVSTMFDRIQHPARGREGGQAGAHGVFCLKEGQALAGKGRHLVPAGATLVIQTPGGAGLGEPASRDPEARKSDLRAGYITEDGAPNTSG